MADEVVTAPNVIENKATQRLRESMSKQEEPSNGTTQTEIKNEEAKTPEAEVLKQPEVKAEAKPAPEEKKEVAPTAESDLQAFLKRNNISSEQELVEKITPKRVKTPDEEETELMDYAVKNENLKVDDFIAAKNIEKIKDADVAFEDYSQKRQARNKNVTPQEIQEGFNKKFGDVVIDGDGNEKVVLDTDELADYASRIREEKTAPIKAARGKYQSHVAEQTFQNQVGKEFNEIQKSLTDKVSIRIDDKNVVDYELEPKYKQQLTEELSQHYQFLRKNLPSNEQFDFGKYKQWFVEEYVPSVVLKHNFGNIANIHAAKKVTEKELEHGKALENPIIDSPNLNGGAKPTVDMQAEAAKLRQNLKSLK